MASYLVFAVAAFVTYWVYQVLRMLQNGKNHPEVPGKVACKYSLILPGDLGHFFLPEIPFIHTVGGRSHHLTIDKYFNETGCDSLCLIGPDRCVFHTRDVQASKEALYVKRNEINKPVQFYKVLDFFGKNVVTLNGQEWLRHRTVLQPAFSDLNLRYDAEVTAEFVNETIQRWMTMLTTGKNTVDMDPELIRITFKVICKAGFGVSSLELDEKNKTNEGEMTLADALQVISEETKLKLLVPDFLLKNLPFERTKRVYKGFEMFKEFCFSVINNRRQTYVEGRDLLNLLLQANENDSRHHLDDNEIVANTYIFMLAGHETTAHTLLWTFNLLAMHPEIQEKAYEEVMEVLGPDRDPNYDDYRKLQYCEAIMKETLRLFPAVVGIPKMAAQDTELNGAFVPKGTYVDVNAYSMSRHSKYWDNPNVFNPSRFDERVSPPVDPNLFIAFSRGPRGCIGFRFALIEGTLTIAMLIRKFRFHHPPGTDFKAMLHGASQLTLKPTANVKLEIELRA